MGCQYCSYAINMEICVTDICSEYAWIAPLIDKKELQLLMLFRK